MTVGLFVFICDRAQNKRVSVPTVTPSMPRSPEFSSRFIRAFQMVYGFLSTTSQVRLCQGAKASSLAIIFHTNSLPVY